MRAKLLWREIGSDRKKQRERKHMSRKKKEKESPDKQQLARDQKGKRNNEKMERDRESQGNQSTSLRVYLKVQIRYLRVYFDSKAALSEVWTQNCFVVNKETILRGEKKSLFWYRSPRLN